MRIIAGIFRSRQLKPLKHLNLRPTSDMLRETLFNILGPRVEGARFLDLFAGTGAVGIEAISRGATAVFVENHSATVRLLRENLAALEIKSAARVIPASVAQGLAKLTSESPPSSETNQAAVSLHKTESAPGVAATAPNYKSSTTFDFVFLDPPYANELDYHSTLETLAQSSLLADDAVVIAEHHKKSPLPKSFGGLQQFRTVTQGDATLTFYRTS
jgi:16S rRNA G966 N2-methylase RsmD